MQITGYEPLVGGMYLEHAEEAKGTDEGGVDFLHGREVRRIERQHLRHPCTYERGTPVDITDTVGRCLFTQSAIFYSIGDWLHFFHCDCLMQTRRSGVVARG